MSKSEHNQQRKALHSDPIFLHNQVPYKENVINSPEKASYLKDLFGIAHRTISRSFCCCPHKPLYFQSLPKAFL
jgi:hypothetical protein